HLALLAAYAPGAARVRAVVNFYGPADLAAGYRDPPRPDPYDVRGVVADFMGGTPDALPARYAAASPVRYARAGLPPTLHLYGGRDHIVAARFGRALHARLRAAGATSVYLELPWSEHGFNALLSGMGGQLSLYYSERFLAWALAASAPKPAAARHLPIGGPRRGVSSTRPAAAADTRVPRAAAAASPRQRCPLWHHPPRRPPLESTRCACAPTPSTGAPRSAAASTSGSHA
ncbi:MAG: hypothetical protein AVDCRST_MAG11-2866, partial [uncultured Gemmatimonadaceae bacterium]